MIHLIGQRYRWQWANSFHHSDLIVELLAPAFDLTYKVKVISVLSSNLWCDTVGYITDVDFTIFKGNYFQ